MSFYLTNRVIQCPLNLTCCEKIILANIASYANKNDFSCISALRICEECNVSLITYKRAVAKMKKMGILQKKGNDFFIVKSALEKAHCASTKKEKMETYRRATQ